MLLRSQVAFLFREDKSLFPQHFDDYKTLMQAKCQILHKIKQIMRATKLL